MASYERNDDSITIPLQSRKPRHSLKYGITGDEESLYLQDGRRRIDYVLVFQTGSKAADMRKASKRTMFQEQLENEGVDFEISTEPVPGDPDSQLCFVKLHATWELLTRYADITRMRMPLKQTLEVYPEDEISRHCPNPFRYDRNLLPKLPRYVTTGFSDSKKELFNITDKETFFSPSQRSKILWECLSRIRVDKANLGIQRLLADGTFIAAYPLHDGPLTDAKGGTPKNLRAVLFREWGRFRNFYKFQPIEYIRNYFGEKVGFYFAWMEFYTLMLVPAMVVGILCMIYGALTVNDHVPNNDVCTNDEISNTVMCPICHGQCPYWRLKESCSTVKATYLIDNPGTVGFAVFMALWSSLFVMLWKRKEAILSWNFDTYHLAPQDEPVRAELEAKIPPENWKTNPATGINEPHISPVRRVLQILLSSSVVVFMIILVLIATIAIIVYRVIAIGAIYERYAAMEEDPSRLNEPVKAVDEPPFTVRYSVYIVGISAAFLNLIIIMVLNSVYFRIAKWLTELENHRTQSEFEDSLTVKYYVFEFVNTYSSLFYIAFIKGRVPPALPGSKSLFGLTSRESCDKSGCLIELTIQLAVLFIGSGVINFSVDLILPALLRRFAKARLRWTDQPLDAQWERDFLLATFPPMGLFAEYSRAVTQFGFVTMFVAAFPLAPIFALINSLVEIRLNAFKFLVSFRRPVSISAKNIGVWKTIIVNIARLSILTNALIIAFTSDFVPKIVYILKHSDNWNLNGYTQWSLAEFYVKDFPFRTEPRAEFAGPGFGVEPPTSCWYRELRTGPDLGSGTHRRPYLLSLDFWHVLAARVILVLVFEHFVILVTKVVSFFVPGEPATLKAKMQRENYLARETFYEIESRKFVHQRKSTKRNYLSAPEKDE